MIKYSFVLPAYKARFFKEALDSVLHQTYKDFELIIVNDASPEDLESIVNKYDDPRIRYYVNEQNMGGKDLVAQWNHCLEYAKGEYIILASDDDVYFPMYLTKMDMLVRRFPNVNVFRPRVQRINKNGNIISVENEFNEIISQAEFSYLWFKDHISGIPFYIFKRRALEDIGGFINFPLAWFSDDATVIKICGKNGMVTTNEVLFSFRESGVNITSTINNEKNLYDKLIATELFYTWFIEELKCMICTNDDEKNNIAIINDRYHYQKKEWMIWLIKQSIYKRNIFASWRMLRKMKTIKIIDSIEIILRVLLIKPKFLRNFLKIISK